MNTYDVCRAKRPDSQAKPLGTLKSTDAAKALRPAHERIEAPPGGLWVDESDVDDTCQV